MIKTQFVVNNKPVYKTNYGSLFYTNKAGQKVEMLGMAPIVALREQETVTQHNEVAS